MNLHYLNVIRYRAFAEMRAEVSNGFLGMSIWFIEPIVYLGAFYLVFAVLDIRGGGDAIPFLLPGLVIWKWFAVSVGKGASSIKSSAYMMQQIYVPKAVFIGTELLTSFYHFLIIFTLLIVFLIFYGLEITSSWWSLIPVIFVEFMLIVAIAGIFAVLIPFVPDLNLVVSNGLTLVFFLSGIFFDVSQAPGVFKTILYLNPMAVLVDAYRTIFLHGQNPDWALLGYVLAFSVVLIAIATVLLKKWDRKYPKVLS